MTTGAVDGRPTSLHEFLKWIDNKDPVRRECLLIPMGRAFVQNGDVEGLREVVKRLPDRSAAQNDLKASLERFAR
jgi:hypothetical protein